MNTSAQCSVLSAPLKPLDPKSKLSMDLTAAYQRVRKFAGVAFAYGAKERNRAWARQQLAAALLEYDALKKQAEREGFKA